MRPNITVATQEMIDVGRFLHGRGWVPATGGNISARLDDGTIAITVSGRHKGELVVNDIMRVDLNGQSLDGKKPSAETLLHTGLYKLRPDVNAVVHGHPRASVVHSLVFRDTDRIDLEGYELLKAFPGVKTHETVVTLPVFENSQDMVALQRDIDAWYAGHPQAPSTYLVRGHGLTAGADTIQTARYIFEATEELLAYELERSRF